MNGVGKRPHVDLVHRLIIHISGGSLDCLVVIFAVNPGVAVQLLFIAHKML